MMSKAFVIALVGLVACAHAANLRTTTLTIDEKSKDIEGWATPEVVPRGHFAALLKNDTSDLPNFVPITVAPGSLNPKNAPPQPLIPLAKPEIVGHGYFEQERIKAHFDALAKVNGPTQEQQLAVCKVLSNTLTLARSVYQIESDPRFSSSKSILSLIQSICPLLKTRYPEATQNMSCLDIEQRIDRYYNPMYKGLVVPLRQLCGEEIAPANPAPGATMNYALAVALNDVSTLFGVSFCPKQKFCNDEEFDPIASVISANEKKETAPVADPNSELVEPTSLDLTTSVNQWPPTEADLQALQSVLSASEKHLAALKLAQ